MRFPTFWRRKGAGGEPAERLGAVLVALGNRHRVPKLLVEEHGSIRYANGAAAALLGLDREAMARADVFSWVHPDDEERARSDLAAFVAGRLSAPPSEYGVRRGDGSWARVAVDAMNLLDFQPAQGVLLTAHDITALRDQEQQLRHLALRDPTTGIGNRRALLRDLGTAMEVERPLAVVFVDLDHFRRVNDSLGHTAGDEVLGTVAERLVTACRSGMAVHHFSADTFVVSIPGADGDTAVTVTWDLLTAVARPLFVGGVELRLTATAGVALREPGATPGSILRDADAALTRAKARRRGGVELFTDTMRADAVQRLAIESDLRGALERDELFLHLQPIVAMETREPVASEVLVRWERPAGEVPTALFVSVAEDAGLIGQLGDRVLTRAIALLESDQAARVSLNLSARQLFDPRLPADVARLLGTHGVDPRRLAFEITETVVVEDHALAASAIRSLRSLGCGVGLDDFGTGYSSLGYLRHFPVDFLKIDRALVADVDTNAQAARIVQAVVSLAKALGMCTVAEGVEREVQLAPLLDAGVDFGQGWFFGRPAAPGSPG